MNSEIKAFLGRFPGALDDYAIFRAQGHRKGQAFFNSLPANYAAFLRGTIFDPFHHDTDGACVRAIAYLEQYVIVA